MRSTIVSIQDFMKFKQDLINQEGKFQKILFFQNFLEEITKLLLEILMDLKQILYVKNPIKQYISKYLKVYWMKLPEIESLEVWKKLMITTLNMS